MYAYEFDASGPRRADSDVVSGNQSSGYAASAASETHSSEARCSSRVKVAARGIPRGPRNGARSLSRRQTRVASDAAKARLRIAVVDPRPEQYRQLFAACPRSVDLVFCRTGEEALRAAHGSVAAWLINSSLPDMAGLELHQLLRPHLAAGNGGRVPVFLVADEYDPAVEVAALCTGSIQFVCHPLPATWLVELGPMLARRAAPAA